MSQEKQVWSPKQTVNNPNMIIADPSSAISECIPNGFSSPPTTDTGQSRTPSGQAPLQNVSETEMSTQNVPLPYDSPPSRQLDAMTCLAIRETDRQIQILNRQKNYLIFKEQLKHKRVRFFHDSRGYTLQLITQDNTICFSDIVFPMTIKKHCILRDEKNKLRGHLFEVCSTIINQTERFIIKTPDQYLTDRSLKNSPFSHYFNRSSQYEKLAFKELAKDLSVSSPEFLFCPSKPGWWPTADNKIGFWCRRSDIELSEMLPGISTVSLPDNMHNSDVIIPPVTEMCKGSPIIGVLLLYRIGILIQPIIKKRTSMPRLCIIGENSFNTAYDLLNPLLDMDNKFRLDTENKSSLIKRLKALHFGPALCFSRGFQSTSSISRLNELMSEIDSSQTNPSPLVICLSCIPKGIEFADIVIESNVIDNDTLTGWSRLFNHIQNVLIQKIEASGLYYEELFNEKITIKRSSILDLGAELINSINLEITNKLSDLIIEGGNYIHSQTKVRGSELLLEFFKETVIKLTETNCLKTVPRKNVPHDKSEDRRPIVYFDDDWYYITTSCFSEICQQGNLTDKSKVLIKTRLAETENLKIYQHSSSHLEFCTDFKCIFSDHQEYKSGLAIKSSFFDDPFGLKLSERSDL